MSYDVARALRELGIEGAPERGGRIEALCPFHADRNPSWSIDTSLGIHWCFSCKSGGTLINLVMHVLGCGFPFAIGWVEEHASPQTALRVRFEQLPKDVPFRMPAQAVEAPLDEWPDQARDYVLSRGITALQAARWRLAYVVDGDLSGRVLLPVYAQDGCPLTYSARTFVGDRKRYLTPKRTENPVAGAVFGEAHWPHARDRRRVYVTEGAIDALAVERVAPAGSCIATLSGSDPQIESVEKLATFPEVVVLTDADLAGERAARHLRAALARSTEVARVAFPHGEDAASLDPATLARYLVVDGQAQHDHGDRPPR